MLNMLPKVCVYMYFSSVSLKTTNNNERKKVELYDGYFKYMYLNVL